MIIFFLFLANGFGPGKMASGPFPGPGAPGTMIPPPGAIGEFYFLRYITY